MLDSNVIKKIEDFVYSRPRSVQEIAQYIGKNWRTADRYLDAIQKDYGTVSTIVFREGTRGALKIVYWASVEKASNSIFQEKLERDIFTAKRKEAFSAFDIFQHVPDKDKKVSIKRNEDSLNNIKEVSSYLLATKKQLLIFSGNLSFVNLKNKNVNLYDVFEALVKRNVPIKILCRVDLAGKENVERILSLNFKYGKELVEVRHAEHPLRAFIRDGNSFRIKEIQEPTGKNFEMKDKLFIYYTLNNKDWAQWASKIFWKMFSSSINADRRLQEINKLGLFNNF